MIHNKAYEVERKGFVQIFRVSRYRTYAILFLFRNLFSCWLLALHLASFISISLHLSLFTLN